METLKNLNKFWRISTLLPSATTATCNPTEEVLAAGGEEEEEESFFELESVMLTCCRTETSTTAAPSRGKDGESFRLSSKEGNMGIRVVPIGPVLTPISIAKSAPKTGLAKLSTVPCPQTDLDLTPKLEQGKISTLIRENSSSSAPKALRQNDIIVNRPEDASKRFSKDVMHKYLKLKLSKPFYLRVACKQLGKSRSVGVANRRDELLLEHDDGIQSAILHCKRSFQFHSSRESAMHSGTSSDWTEQEETLPATARALDVIINLLEDGVVI